MSHTRWRVHLVLVLVEDLKMTMTMFFGLLRITGKQQIHCKLVYILWPEFIDFNQKPCILGLLATSKISHSMFCDLKLPSKNWFCVKTLCWTSYMKPFCFAMYKQSTGYQIKLRIIAWLSIVGAKLRVRMSCFVSPCTNQIK